MRIDPHRSFYAPAARALERLGTLFSRSGFGSAVSLFARLLRLFAESVRRGHQATNQLLVSQIYFTSVEAVPLIALVAALLGTVVVMQALTVMPKVGFGGFFGGEPVEVNFVFGVREFPSGRIAAHFFAACSALRPGFGF